MDVKTYQPGKEYLVKLRVTFSLIAFVILLFGMFLTIIIAIENGEGGCIVFPIILTLDLIWYGAAMTLSGPYFRSLRDPRHQLQPPDERPEVGEHRSEPQDAQRDCHPRRRSLRQDCRTGQGCDRLRTRTTQRFPKPSDSIAGLLLFTGPITSAGSIVLR